MYSPSLYTHFFVRQNNIFCLNVFLEWCFPSWYFYEKVMSPKTTNLDRKSWASYSGAAVHLAILTTALYSSVIFSTFFLRIGGQSCIPNFSYGFIVTLFNTSISYLFSVFLPPIFIIICFLMEKPFCLWSEVTVTIYYFSFLWKLNDTLSSLYSSLLPRLLQKFWNV